MASVTDTGAVRRLFDDLAPEYDQHIPFFGTFGRELVEWCGLRPGQRVLDIAAGRGAIAGPAARAVGEQGHVLAIDNSPAMLRSLAKDHPGLPQLATRVMDAHDLELPDASVDVVTCGFALHFLDDPARAIAEAHRVLRPGGLLVFSGLSTEPVDEEREPDLRWDFYHELMREMSERTSPTKRPNPFTPPPAPLHEMCADAGFHARERRIVREAFPVRDAQHHWDWNMSHGFRGFVESLGPELAREFRDRMLAGLRGLETTGGLAVEAAIAFNRFTAS
jgi:ubiquinone/menaquinone biosynthesis C-methylase UbiE